MGIALTSQDFRRMSEFLDAMNALSEKYDIWLCEYGRTTARLGQGGNVLAEITRKPREDAPTAHEYAWHFPNGDV